MVPRRSSAVGIGDPNYYAELVDGADEEEARVMSPVTTMATKSQLVVGLQCFVIAHSKMNPKHQ